MRHIAAYAMLVLGGKDAPKPAEVEKVVKDAGAEVDKDKIAALCKAMEGKPFEELVETGLKTLSSMGGSAAPAGGAPAGGKAEAKKEAEKEESEDVDMGGMFGDEDDY